MNIHKNIAPSMAKLASKTLRLYAPAHTKRQRRYQRIKLNHSNCGRTLTCIVYLLLTYQHVNI